MDRKIEEDFKLAWKPVGVMFGVVTALLMGMLILAAVKVHDLKLCLMAGGLLLVLPFFYWFTRRQSLKDLATRAKTWVQTDTGLRCTYGDPPETETIRWSQIRRMRWARPGGLILIWEESSPRGPQFRDHFREDDIAGRYRTVLRVRESEADLLAAAWNKFRKTQAAEVLPEPEHKFGVPPSGGAPEPTPPTGPEHQPAGPDLGAHHFRPQRHHASARPKLNRQLQFTVRLGSLMGLFFIGWACLNIFQEFPSASWPVAQGKIISSDFREIPWDGHHTQKGQVSLVYKYTVNGQPHIAQQYGVRHQSFVDFLDNARAFASAHPTGDTIEVHYDPQDPAKAVLKAGVDWKDDSSCLVLGLFFLSITLFVRWAVLRQATQVRRPESNWLMKEYSDRN